MLITSASPLHRRALPRQAADAIREMIVAGQLADGQRLVEQDLSAQLNISRTPLREALRQLQAEGMVVMHPHRGASVAVMTAQETADIFQVLANLEGLAVRLAVPRLDDAALCRLTALHDRMLRYRAAGRRRDCFEADQAIHQMLMDTAGNATLAATRDLLMQRARRRRYHAFFTMARWDEAMAEHDAFMQALIARDAATGEAVMVGHVLNTGRALCAAMAAGQTQPIDNNPAEAPGEKQGDIG